MIDKFVIELNTFYTLGFVLFVGAAVFFGLRLAVLFFRHLNLRYSALGFERALFTYVISNVSNKKGPWREYKELQKTLDRLSPTQRDQEAASIYFQIEDNYLLQKSRHKLSREGLRTKIFKACSAQKADGVFAMIFLPQHLQMLRLYEHFVDILFVKSKLLLSAESFKKTISVFSQINYPVKFSGEESLKWRIIEKTFSDRDYEHQFEEIKKISTQFTAKLLQYSIEDIGTDRAENLFREAYQDFKQRHLFIGPDMIAQVLHIIPEGILSIERISILPKADLEEAVRSRTQELESALGKVEEQRKLLDRALADLQRNDVLKTEFIDVISHQFRTPLSVIRWHSELLEDNVMPYMPSDKADDIKESIKALYTKSVFLIDLLEDLFDVLAMEKESFLLNKQPCQLWEIITDVCNEMQKDAVKRSIKLSFDKTSPIFSEALLDKEKIARTVRILLRNAIQYTPENGSVKVNIIETASDGVKTITCSIEDTGIGIPAEEIPNLFSRFHRAANAVRQVPDGAGIGLYLVKKFVEGHGGKVEVFSELNKGTKFVISLPAV